MKITVCLHCPFTSLSISFQVSDYFCCTNTSQILFGNLPADSCHRELGSELERLFVSASILVFKCTGTSFTLIFEDICQNYPTRPLKHCMLFPCRAWQCCYENTSLPVCNIVLTYFRYFIPKVNNNNDNNESISLHKKVILELSSTQHRCTKHSPSD